MRSDVKNARIKLSGRKRAKVIDFQKEKAVLVILRCKFQRSDSLSF